MDVKYVETVLSKKELNTLTKQKNRELDKILGEQYRKESPPNLSYSDYKKLWLQAQKDKQMKIHYTAFEPMPNESLEDFKKRIGGCTILIPVESIAEYKNRVSATFNQHLFK